MYKLVAMWSMNTAFILLLIIYYNIIYTVYNMCQMMKLEYENIFYWKLVLSTILVSKIMLSCNINLMC